MCQDGQRPGNLPALAAALCTRPALRRIDLVPPRPRPNAPCSPGCQDAANRKLAGNPTAPHERLLQLVQAFPCATVGRHGCIWSPECRDAWVPTVSFALLLHAGTKSRLHPSLPRCPCAQQGSSSQQVCLHGLDQAAFPMLAELFEANCQLRQQREGLVEDQLMEWECPPSNSQVPSSPHGPHRGASPSLARPVVALVQLRLPAHVEMAERGGSQRLNGTQYPSTELAMGLV
mmetsp:Transcript_16035/g.36771  ORF Transcript_16035/g.36771 Transcript_16035/m.36771 type:complete len:232 (-) Transcript_16035:1165-1860(-)